jgi:Domain of unknown function (DUF4349)
MTPFLTLSLLFVSALVGCGTESRVNSRNFALHEGVSKAATSGEAMPPAAVAAANPTGILLRSVTDEASATLAALQPGPQATKASSTAIARKIIYDAQVDLIVGSVDPVARNVGSLVQEARGYIAEQSVSGSPGSQRSMHWKFRIPVEQFDSFVDSIIALGELERNSRTSQDVTEQYYDLEARIKNKKIEEQTLNKILQERSGKLEDVLKIEIVVLARTPITAPRAPAAGE